MKQAGLEALFDFQHFWKNTHLESLAEETMKRYGSGLPDNELSDNDLSLVSAAGEPEAMEAVINLLRKEDGGDG